MKVKSMLELGNDCGLVTVSEAYSNVNLHAGMMFAYTAIEAELKELVDELKSMELLNLNDDGYFEFLDITIKEVLETLS